MIKHIAFRIIKYRLKSVLLPKISSSLYKKIFTYSYKFFIYLKPSQIWNIVLALLNKTEFKKLISIPSIFVLFSSIFSESSDSQINSNVLQAKLEENKLTDTDNNWEKFFFIIIIFALIRRFTVTLFKFLWIPFKIALIYYVLKYFGYDFSSIFNTLNNLSLGIIDWFHDKITDFLEMFNKNYKKN